jgi:hypothetical protein
VSDHGKRQMTCPECGENAYHRPPADLVRWEAHGITRPEWSHRDGSSLCPVIGPSGGYRPAQPAEAAPRAETRADGARPHPITPPGQPGNWDPSSRFGPQHDSEGQLIECHIAPLGDIPAGQPGNRARQLSAFRAAHNRIAAAIGRNYRKAAIARRNGLEPPAAAEPAERGGRPVNPRLGLPRSAGDPLDPTRNRTACSNHKTTTRATR